MKHIGVYFILFFFLCTHTSLGELLKMPFLGEHYMEHKKRDPKLGLMQFMSMHYWGKDISDQPYRPPQV